MEGVASEYYRVQYTPIVENANRTWRGKARIFRKDNSEQVAQISIREGQSTHDVKNRLVVQVRTKLTDLPHPPEDWGLDDAIPTLIQRYLTIRDKTYDFFVRAEDESSEVKARELRGQGDAFEALELKKLQQDISMLSEIQKIALVTPTNQHRVNRTDSRILDVLAAKKVLYGLIDYPSLGVQAGYYDLETLLNLEAPA